MKLPKSEEIDDSFRFYLCYAAIRRARQLVESGASADAIRLVLATPGSIMYAMGDPDPSKEKLTQAYDLLDICISDSGILAVPSITRAKAEGDTGTVNFIEAQMKKARKQYD